MDTFCLDSVGIWRFMGEIIYIIRIVVPIIIVLLGTIDLGKAVMSGEEKTVKESQKSFIKRLIYGVAIFFIFIIVEVIFGLLGVETDKGDTKVCWDCATKPHNKSCISYVKEHDEKREKEREEIIEEDKNNKEQEEKNEETEEKSLEEL